MINDKNFKDFLSHHHVINTDVLLILDELLSGKMSMSMFHSRKRYAKLTNNLPLILNLAITFELVKHFSRSNKSE